VVRVFVKCRWFYLDRINRIIWISFLRHFPEESGETQSRLVAGKNSNMVQIMWVIAIITYKYHCSFYAFAEGDGAFWLSSGKPKRIS
jgi:hypothetical protein